MASISGYNETSQTLYDELVERIKEDFNQIISLVVERMDSLLFSLAEFQNKMERNKQIFTKLNSIKEEIEGIRENDLKTKKDKWLSDIDEEFEDLTLSPPHFMYEFEVDITNIKREINNWGKIVKTNKILDYSNMKDPVVAVIALTPR